jgi:hypothetical protein
MPLSVGTRLTSIGERKGATFSATQVGHLMENAHSPDLVYFTTDRELARAWCVRSNGALLRVEPVGTVEADPDFPGTSFSAEQAVVLGVQECPVKMRHLEARKAFAAYDPDSFDELGYIRPAEREKLSRSVDRVFGLSDLAPLLIRGRGIVDVSSLLCAVSGVGT